MPKKIILFICSGNTCRSPMAEGIMRAKLAQHALNDEYETASAGLCVMEPSGANAKSIAVCAENGIDISSHQARQADKEMMMNSMLILTMTQAHKFDIIENIPQCGSNVFTLKEYAAKFSNNLSNGTPGILDPYGGDLAVYRNAFNAIHTCIDIIIQNLITKQEEL